DCAVETAVNVDTALRAHLALPGRVPGDDRSRRIDVRNHRRSGWLGRGRAPLLLLAAATVCPRAIGVFFLCFEGLFLEQILIFFDVVVSELLAKSAHLPLEAVAPVIASKHAPTSPSQRRGASLTRSCGGACRESERRPVIAFLRKTGAYGQSRTGRQGECNPHTLLI